MRMDKKVVVVGIVILLISVGLSGCTSPENENHNGESQYTPKPNIKVSDCTDRTGYEGIDYCFYIDIIVKNYGDGDGSAYVWGEVKQDGNSWEKRQKVYLNSGETDSLTLTFCEISFWSGSGGSYRVWVE